jgi:phosphoribosylaminoimidazolecarboxamide formyltransferase/IMP cyclohydrolase
MVNIIKTPMDIKIRTALISVYSKDRIAEIAQLLLDLGIKILSTGGTYDYLKKQGLDVTSVESVTGYPSIFGGRVKTLHPKIMGGILYRRDDPDDIQELKKYEIPPVDLIIVDLYPFEDTVATSNDETEIIEKIDIGGISLIRAAAKNFKDVLIIPSAIHYSKLIELLENKKGITSLEDRKYFAAQAFNISSHYDTKSSNISIKIRTYLPSKKAFYNHFH